VRAALAALPRPEWPTARWTPPEQWHVTLVFLGSCPVEAALAALPRAGGPPADAVAGPRVERLGRHVLMLPVAGVDALARSVRAAFAGVGQPPEPTFRGHLTLARLRRGSAPPGVVGTAFDARWPAREIALVRSHTDPRGVRYETLLTLPLS
jgi:2'-5' RNA ligase